MREWSDEKKPSKFAPEVRERVVRLVREQRNKHPSLWAVVESTARIIGSTPKTLHERLAEAGIEPSVGSQGDSYDNALAETTNGLYKTGLIHCRTWKIRESVELATVE